MIHKSLPIGSMYEYISLHLVDSYGQLVGKYTSLMDPMGYSYISTHTFLFKDFL